MKDELTKANVGLGNVDNTADADKIVKSAGTCTGNSATATKLATKRSISLTGDVSGSAEFDGSGDASITVTVKDDSHNHVISNVDGLQDALDGKEASGAAATALTNAKS